MADLDRTLTTDLAAFIDRSPSPFHAVATVAARLTANGFAEVAEIDNWAPPLQGFVRRGGALIAWLAPGSATPISPLRIVGAHTDSPNLRIKPSPETGAVGIGQLGVEVYGGALLNSWLDRDLGLSGRVALLGEAVVDRLVVVDRPVLRVSQLAIHLDREVNERGLLLDRQRHLAPMWCEGDATPGAFAAWLAAEMNEATDAVGGWDLMVHDLQPARLIGAGEEWLAAPRIDNLASCHGATRALLDADVDAGHIAVLCLFDHEEVGSTSSTGAGGAMLPTVLMRLNAALGGTAVELARSLAASACVSADGAHATHPNYVDRHEPHHVIRLNGGPVIKRNSNERYATDAVGQALAIAACRAAGVPHQVFVNRTDLACGSTIGPITAAQLGITTVDLGLAQLSMHSARELCGADDPPRLTAVLRAFFSGC